MMALTEEKVTVYYTRGSGELSVERPVDPAEAAVARAAYRLQDAFSATQCEARPLVIDPFAADAKVPDDAGVVVVLDPLTPLPPATAAAIQRYMTTPRPGGKKGKLLLFAAAHNAPGTTQLSRTGLEPMLVGLGIDLSERVIYTEHSERRVPTDLMAVMPGKVAANQRNPIALAAAGGIYARTIRPVLTPEEARPGAGAPLPLLYAVSDGPTWIEKAVVQPPQKALTDMVAASQRGDAAYQRERQLGNTPRAAAVAANDADGKPSVVVFGFAEGLSDDASAGESGRSDVIFKAALGWLRERPAGPDISPKEYVEYVPRKGVNENLLFTVPVAGTVLAIILLGLGVWAVRRK